MLETSNDESQKLEETTLVCAIRLPLRMDCLFTHANTLGLGQITRTYNFAYSAI
jgi:hypothetical protein